MKTALLMVSLAVSILPQSAVVFADLKAPDFTIASKQDASIWVLTATPPALHHFNIQAPMSADSIKPTSSSEQSVVFKIPASALKAPGKITVALYLCDDAKTFCERHRVNYSLSGAAAQTAATTSTATVTAAAEPEENSETVSTASAHSSKDHGFLVNAPDQALAQAKREGKPVMIDFFGIWCPPCNELDEKVFSTHAFNQSASRFVRLKLDADAKISWKMKSQYQVGGYPTVVFISPEGDEISRIVGSRPLAEFLSEMDDAWRNRSTPLVSLEKKAQEGDREAADRAGIIRLNRGDAVAAAKLLKDSKAQKESWHLAELQVLEDTNASNDKQVSRLNQAIADFPKTPHTVEWMEKLSKIYEDRKEDEKRKAVLKRAMDLCLELSDSPQGLKGYDATPADLLESRAQYHEQIDGKTAARPDWLAAAHAYSLQGVGEKERANNLELAFCLGKAGDLASARTIYARLERAYPEEFTFYFGHARMEADHENFAQALPLANQALDRSYGDNRLRAVILVARIHESLGEKDKSRTILDATLKGLDLPIDEKVRTHHFAKVIREMRAKLN